VLRRIGQRAGEVTLNMKLDPDAPPPPPPDEVHDKISPPPPPPQQTGGGLRTAGVVVLTVGGAGVVVGVIFGLVAVGNKSDLDKLCPMKDMCPLLSQEKIDSANVMGWVSTVGFIAGGVAVAAGATMILLSGGGAPRKTTGVRPWIGPGSAGLSGTF